MAHTQYTFHTPGPEQPPGKLLYISSASYGKDWLSMLHAHSFTELFYVVNGDGYFSSEDGDKPIHKDSLIIINPNTRHTEKSSSAKRLTYIALGIDNTQFEFTEDGKKLNTPYHIYDFHNHQQHILPLMKEMLAEIIEKKNGHEEICQNYFSILMLRILRITRESCSIAAPSVVPPECAVIKQYMDSHYKEGITLDLLAEVSHLNKYYLSHIFSDAFGISPINYLLERRILHSKDLLKNSDFTITQIAQLSGFSSSNYFSQSFKKYTGLTPRAYREKHDIRS